MKAGTRPVRLWQCACVLLFVAHAAVTAADSLGGRAPVLSPEMDWPHATEPFLPSVFLSEEERMSLLETSANPEEGNDGDDDSTSQSDAWDPPAQLPNATQSQSSQSGGFFPPVVPLKNLAQWKQIFKKLSAEAKTSPGTYLRRVVPLMSFANRDDLSNFNRFIKQQRVPGKKPGCVGLLNDKAIMEKCQKPVSTRCLFTQGFMMLLFDMHTSRERYQLRKARDVCNHQDKFIKGHPFGAVGNSFLLVIRGGPKHHAIVVVDSIKPLRFNIYQSWLNHYGPVVVEGLTERDMCGVFRGEQKSLEKAFNVNKDASFFKGDFMAQVLWSEMLLDPVIPSNKINVSKVWPCLADTKRVAACLGKVGANKVLEVGYRPRTSKQDSVYRY